MRDNIPGGFILLHRKMLKWEWYDDANTKILFLHLLLTANYEPKKWHGISIERGQVLTSLKKLSEELNMSKDTVLRTLKKLEETGEVQRSPTAQYTIITLKNYCRYQEPATLSDREPTASRPQADREPTQHNKYNKDNKDNKENNTRARGTDARSLPAPASPDVTEAITEQELTEKYGIEATERYKRKFQRWCEKKNITDRDCIATIADWMEQDGVKKTQESASCLNLSEIEKSLLEQYKREV